MASRDRARTHWHIEAARRCSGPGREKAADAGLGLLQWGRITACHSHALGCAQCGAQCGPDVDHREIKIKSASIHAHIHTCTHAGVALTHNGHHRRSATRDPARLAQVRFKLRG